MYKNFIFDFYGTLVDIRTNENKPYLWQKMSELYGALGASYTPAELKAEFRRIEKQLADAAYSAIPKEKVGYYTPEVDLTKAFYQLYKNKGADCDDKTAQLTAVFFRNLSRKLLVRYPYVRETLLKLREDGKKVYLLSNAQTDFTAPEIKLAGVEDCFDGMLLSAKEGCKKPSMAFFDLLLSRYDLNPAECLMTGNDETSDIAGGIAAGMGTLYIHTDTSPEFTGKYCPDYRVMDGDWGKVRDILLEAAFGK